MHTRMPLFLIGGLAIAGALIGWLLWKTPFLVLVSVRPQLIAPRRSKRRPLRRATKTPSVRVIGKRQGASTHHNGF